MLDHAGDPKVITPARHWAATATIGDPVNITRPQGNLVIEHDAPYHLFAGEETASVAFAAMLRSLPSTAEVHGVIEGATDADHLPLARPLTHVERGDASAANSVVLAEALRALPLPDHPGVAYLAGEARTIQSLRKTLVTERGWDRRNIRTKPFWTPGRSGMEQPARPQPPPSARDRACRPAASRGVRAQAGWRLSASRPARARQSAPGQHVAVGRFHGSSLGQIRMVRQ
jgi:ferredoxin-NADP reductase